MTRAQYARGMDFPHEGFVQQAVERYFLALGFTIIPSGETDLICEHPTTGERWEIEAKGETTAIGLDFRTGLGQLVQRMSAPPVRHALALPATPAFLKQCGEVPPWVRQALHLYWLLVSGDGAVREVSPDESRIKPGRPS